MSELDLVIFDCDGVLVDSEIIAARVEAGLLAEAGFEIDPLDYAARFAGMGFKDVLIRLEKESEIPFQLRLIDEAEKLLDKRLEREIKAIDGALQVVATLGVKSCICSNSSGKRLEFMLEHTGFAPFFKGHVYSARELPEGENLKPSPDVFLHALKQEGANPDKCFVIEDSVHGVQAARAAGLRVIGFTGASHSYLGHSDELTDAGAETVIHRWADLPATLEALAQWSDLL